jgi:DNA polymerase II small subunit/DNA polymerase delta subunit B
LPDLQRYIDTSTASDYSNQRMRVNMLVDSNEKTVSLGADILVGTQTVLKEDFRKFIEDSGYDRVYLELRIQF